MYAYKCRKCNKEFECCLPALRCTTLNCQSRQIKELSVPHRIEFLPRDTGQEYRKYSDRQARGIRKQQEEWLELELDAKFEDVE